MELEAELVSEEELEPEEELELALDWWTRGWDWPEAERRNSFAGLVMLPRCVQGTSACATDKEQRASKRCQAQSDSRRPPPASPTHAWHQRGRGEWKERGHACRLSIPGKSESPTSVSSPRRRGSRHLGKAESLHLRVILVQVGIQALLAAQ